LCGNAPSSQARNHPRSPTVVNMRRRSWTSAVLSALLTLLALARLGLYE
jgi:hypothetical protein